LRTSLRVLTNTSRGKTAFAAKPVPKLARGGAPTS
jgi:hypothetical protein